jgi:hypothetical protein
MLLERIGSTVSIVGERKMVRKYSLIAAVALAASAGIANADVVTSANGTAGWKTFPGTLNSSNSNRPYWDMGSQDGTNLNIGNLLANGTVSGAPVTPKWWGDNGDYTQNFDQNFYFTRNSQSSSGVLKVEIAGNASINEVGWYDVATGTRHLLWNGAAGPNAVASFTPTTTYGFYINGADGYFYTQSSKNSGTSDDDNQHFAVFQDSTVLGAESYWIGIEDLKAYTFSKEKNGDYNDFVFHVESIPCPPGGGDTPEPASLGVLAIGAAGLMFRRSKKA